MSGAPIPCPNCIGSLKEHAPGCPGARRPEHIGVVERREGVQGGAPCIAGTRIPARMIRGLVRAGESAEQIRDWYPGLTPEDVKAAVAAEHVEDEPDEAVLRREAELEDPEALLFERDALRCKVDVMRREIDRLREEQRNRDLVDEILDAFVEAKQHQTLSSPDNRPWHSERCYRDGAHRDQSLCVCGLTALRARVAELEEAQAEEHEATHAVYDASKEGP